MLKHQTLISLGVRLIWKDGLMFLCGRFINVFSWELVFDVKVFYWQSLFSCCRAEKLFGRGGTSA